MVSESRNEPLPRLSGAAAECCAHDTGGSSPRTSTHSSSKSQRSPCKRAPARLQSPHGADGAMTGKEQGIWTSALIRLSAGITVACILEGRRLRKLALTLLILAGVWAVVWSIAMGARRRRVRPRRNARCGHGRGSDLADRRKGRRHLPARQGREDRRALGRPRAAFPHLRKRQSGGLTLLPRVGRVSPLLARPGPRSVSATRRSRWPPFALCSCGTSPASGSP